MGGLKESDIEEIIQLFQRTPEIEEALIFGSRAMGNYTQRSDVDIALKGEHLTHRIVSSVGVYLNEETNMPYHFDLLLFSNIQNADLIEHIDRVGVQLYAKVNASIALEPPTPYSSDEN
jgi:uncharacterized protein